MSSTSFDIHSVSKYSSDIALLTKSIFVRQTQSEHIVDTVRITSANSGCTRNFTEIGRGVPSASIRYVVLRNSSIGNGRGVPSDWKKNGYLEVKVESHCSYLGHLYLSSSECSAFSGVTFSLMILTNRVSKTSGLNKMVLIFVYGTLKTGQPNHYLIEKETRGVCTPHTPSKAYTVEKYPLVVASRYNIPYMMYAPGKGHNIEGELYEVDDTRLDILDDLENHPRMYERHDVTLTFDLNVASTSQVRAQAYFLVKYKSSLLDLPMISCYKDLVDGKKYHLPKDRDVSAPLFWHEIHTEYEEPKKK